MDRGEMYMNEYYGEIKITVSFKSDKPLEEIQEMLADHNVDSMGDIMAELPDGSVRILTIEEFRNLGWKVRK